jgi:hypothetical protein
MPQAQCSHPAPLAEHGNDVARSGEALQVDKDPAALCAGGHSSFAGLPAHSHTHVWRMWVSSCRAECMVLTRRPLAQVIFACTPLWSTLFGSMLLQEEAMGGWAWGGAAVILVATVLPAVHGARKA